MGHEFEQTLGDNGGQRSSHAAPMGGKRVRHDLVESDHRQLEYYTLRDLYVPIWLGSCQAVPLLTLGFPDVLL